MDNYKHLYEQTKLMLEKYQDEIVPGLREQLEQAKEKNAGLALALLYNSSPNDDCLGEDEWRAIKAELEQVKRERHSELQPQCPIGTGYPGSQKEK